MTNEEQILAWVKEALELRHGEAGDPDGKLELPPAEAGRALVHSTLRRTRVRLDRTEELLANARQMKGRVSRIRSNAEFEAELEFDRAMQERGNNRVREFVTAAEKKADASLDTIEQKRKLQRAKHLESVADEGYEVIKTCYWGLNAVRTELLDMLRIHENMLAVEGQT